MGRRLTEEERVARAIDNFWSKVNKTETCWLWTKATNPDGYGVVATGLRTAKGNSQLIHAHRFSYQLIKQVVLDSKVELDHKCHNPGCVNPNHLRETTRKQNGEHRKGLQANNKSGVNGVYWHKQTGKWYVQVKHHGVRYSGGLFTDLDEANQAAIELRNRLFTHNDTDRKT